MKLSTIRRYRRRHRGLLSVLQKNPVLLLALDLPFVIATATSLRGAAGISMAIGIVHIVTMAFAIFSCRTLPLWVRALANAGVSTIAMMLARSLVALLLPTVASNLGMYLYLVSVNGMTLMEANFLSPKEKPLRVCTNALVHVAALTVLMAVTAVVREYLGNNTLWGVPMPAPFRMSGMLLPFFGFILVGFLLAFIRFLNKKLLAFTTVEDARKELSYMDLDESF